METIWNFIVDLFTTPITLYVVNTLLILTVIFNERKSASAILAWIMVMTFIPVLEKELLWKYPKYIVK